MEKIQNDPYHKGRKKLKRLGVLSVLSGDKKQKQLNHREHREKKIKRNLSACPPPCGPPQAWPVRLRRGLFTPVGVRLPADVLRGFDFYFV